MAHEIPGWTGPLYVPVKVAAVMISKKPWMVYELIKRGFLRAHRPQWGGDMLIHVGDLKAAVEGKQLDELPTEEPQAHDDASAA